MAPLQWDLVGERVYETGVDHGVLYIPNEFGVYDNGVAWNGLTSVSESPEGGEANAKYADNIKYLNLYSAEEFKATIGALTYPDEFAPFDGYAVPTPGVLVGQQGRRSFGLSYRSLVGDDVNANDAGYKLHLIYGATASPSEKEYATVSDSPEPIEFSWELYTIAVAVTGLKPTASITINSTEVDADALAALELILYGDDLVDPRLPLPDEVLALFAGTITEVTPGVPTYNDATDTLTIPATANVTYRNNGVVITAGPHVVTEDPHVTVTPNPGYVLTPGSDDDWGFDFTP